MMSHDSAIYQWQFWQSPVIVVSKSPWIVEWGPHITATSNFLLAFSLTFAYGKPARKVIHHNDTTLGCCNCWKSSPAWIAIMWCKGAVMAKTLRNGCKSPFSVPETQTSRNIALLDLSHLRSLLRYPQTANCFWHTWLSCWRVNRLAGDTGNERRLRFLRLRKHLAEKMAMYTLWIKIE